MSAYVQILDAAGSIRTDAVLRADGVQIPTADPSNPDCAAFRLWIAAGNAPDMVALDGVKTMKIRQLYAACDATIAAGFTSPALGSARVYPMKLTDQQNRDSAYLDLLDGLLPATGSAATPPTWLLWCRDPTTGAWSRSPHTAAQVRQCRQDTRSALAAIQAKLASLVVLTNAATSASTVQAVKW